MIINNRELSEPEVKAYIHKLEDLLRETRPVLRSAIFVNIYSNYYCKCPNCGRNAYQLKER